MLQNCLLVEIPPYRSQRLSTPVHVNFYVCNGKRKRSQYQRFTYVPASGKYSLFILRPGNFKTHSLNCGKKIIEILEFTTRPTSPRQVAEAC